MEIKWTYKIVPFCDVPEKLLNTNLKAAWQENLSNTAEMRELSKHFEEWLDEFGRDGWILTAVGQNCYVFRKGLD